MAQMTERMYIRMPAELHAAVLRLAKQRYMSPSDIARHAMATFVADALKVLSSDGNSNPTQPESSGRT